MEHQPSKYPNRIQSRLPRVAAIVLIATPLATLAVLRTHQYPNAILSGFFFLTLAALSHTFTRTKSLHLTRGPDQRVKMQLYSGNNFGDTLRTELILTSKSVVKISRRLVTHGEWSFAQHILAIKSERAAAGASVDTISFYNHKRAHSTKSRILSYLASPNDRPLVLRGQKAALMPIGFAVLGLVFIGYGSLATDYESLPPEADESVQIEQTPEAME